MRILPLVLIGGAVAAAIATRQRRVQRRKDRQAARHLDPHKRSEGPQSV